MYHKIIFCAALMVLLASAGSAQKMSRVDSLKLELGVGSDSNRHVILYDIAYELTDVDNNQAITYVRHAYQASMKKGDSLYIVKSGLLTGQLLRRLDQPDDAIDMFHKMLPIAQRQNFVKQVKSILNSLAVAYTVKAQFDKALEYHFQSLELREKEGNKPEIAVTLHNIGLVYYKLGQYALSLDYYLKSLEVKREANDTYDLGRTYNNIGLCYNALHDYTKAQDYFDLAFKVCESCNEDIRMEAESGLGISLLEQGKGRLARPHLLKSLEIARRLTNQRYQLENLVQLAKISIEDGELKVAEDYLKQAESLQVIRKYKDIHLTVYRLWSSLLSKAGQFEKALVYEHKHSKLNDSILNEDVIQNMARVQTKYAERQNLAKIADSEQLLKLQDEVISQQRTLNWLLGAVVLLTTALGIVIYRNYVNIRIVNADLAVAKQVIEDQNRFLDHQVQEKTKELVDTNESLMKVNDELDNFIYKTSHDIRGPLASLKGIVNLAILDVKDEKARSYLSKLDLTAEKLNIILTRLLIVNRINHTELKPDAIHFEPIIQEILSLEMKKGVPSKIKIDYQVEPDIQLVSDKEMVKLILENLIDNAIKFYNESERIDSFVRIRVRSENGAVTARVTDNGVGIAQMNRDKIFQMFVRASERSDTGGIGLYLAKLATEKLFGEITLNSSEGKITEFTVKFPPDLQVILDKRKEDKRFNPFDQTMGDRDVKHNVA